MQLLSGAAAGTDCQRVCKVSDSIIPICCGFVVQVNKLYDKQQVLQQVVQLVAQQVHKKIHSKLYNSLPDTSDLSPKCLKTLNVAWWLSG